MKLLLPPPPTGDAGHPWLGGQNLYFPFVMRGVGGLAGREIDSASPVDESLEKPVGFNVDGGFNDHRAVRVPQPSINNQERQTRKRKPLAMLF